MAQTTKSDVLNPEILTEAVQGAFAQKTAFMGSILVSSGAITVAGTMPECGPDAIGKEVTVPYFGLIGEFEENVGDGVAATPKKLSQNSEKSSVVRDTCAFEVTRWAQGNASVNPNVGDPYEESARQAVEAAQRQMDKAMITSFSASPLAMDKYSSGAPVFLDYNFVVNGKGKLGDEMEQLAGMIVHSQTKVDLMKLADSAGNKFLVTSQREGDIDRFCGIPLITSDRVPLTGSTMGTVTSAGTAPPAITLSGTPLGAFDLRIKCTLAGARGTFTIQFSTDGGGTWSADLLSAASVPLIDTTKDPLTGVNGATGITATIANAAASLDNTWSSTANLKVHTLLVARGAGAFWYNRNALSLQTDRNILADSDIGAMHLYRVAHLYRRRRGGTKPGVIVLKHNVTNYVGV